MKVREKLIARTGVLQPRPQSTLGHKMLASFLENRPMFAFGFRVEGLGFSGRGFMSMTRA